MLTPQEVSARSFTKMVMGGYNMTMVDEFLDELTDDYTTLYKENASLKAKLKVLVEKVEEYRATEESMRATLLTAQRMADSTVKEAEAKRDEILRQAEAAAREKLEGYRKEAAESDQRLRMWHEAFQRFIEETKALCAKQIQYLDELPQLPLAEAGEEVQIPVAEIEETVLSAGEAAEPVPAVEEPAVSPSAEELLDTLAAAESREEAPPEEDLSATRRLNIHDLKFGPNYRSEEN